ncbi:MAG: hypothetical protein ACOVP4_09815 [Bacteriovoracaceae bacterium]
MKKLFLALIALSSVSAFAQKHMVNFSNDSLVIGDLSFVSSKDRGSEKDNRTDFGLKVNYAYAVHPHLQVGTKLGLEKAKEGSLKTDNYEIFVGAIYNLELDFRQSYYASLYLGYQKDDAYGVSPVLHSERTVGQLSLGKRFPLKMIGFENLTYSPEVTASSTNYTTSTAADWRQDLKFTFLQFSVFF